MYFKKFLLRFGKTLILIMKVRDASTWILNIARNTSIDKLRSKNNNSQKNLSSDNFVHLLDDSNKLVKVDTIGINEFVKRLKPKCIQIIDLLFFKGYTQQEASEELEIPLGTVKTHKSKLYDLRTYLKV
jgi:RNA polymerase sigma-70 factor (ECF subfamily)